MTESGDDAALVPLPPALRDGLAAVLRDLAAGGVPAPVLRADDGAYLVDGAMVGVMLWRADGSGAGVHMRLDAPSAAQLAEVADGVQDWAFDTLWSTGSSTSWPPCPDHPDRHPMQARIVDDVATWVCPSTSRPIVAIGSLDR